MKPASSSEKVITWTTSQVVLATVFVVCVFLTFLLLYHLRLLIFLLFAAIVIGTAIRPGVEWLQRRGSSLIHVLPGDIRKGHEFKNGPPAVEEAHPK